MNNINNIQEISYFVYSDIYKQEQNKILSKTGKSFKSGHVNVGATTKEFVIECNNIDIGGFLKKYPDANIVCQGQKSKIKYEHPSIL